MQEYVEERTIAISVKAAKLSGKVLAATCKKGICGNCKTARSRQTAQGAAERAETDEPPRR